MSGLAPGGRQEGAAAGLGVTLSCTPGYAMFAVASICSIREHNRDVPVRLFVDDEIPGLARAADRLRFVVERLDTVTSAVRDARGEVGEHIRSRLLKIRAIARASSEPFLYLDSDTLVLDDVVKLQAQLGAQLEDGANIFMLLRRPALQTLWDYGRPNFADAEISREGIAALLNATFGLTLEPGDLKDIKCWNGGVIFGSPAVVGRMAERWLALYEHMITAPNREAFVPYDQLCLWLALREARDFVRAGELPPGWNFLPGLFLQLAPGAHDIDEDDIKAVSVLHLGGNKHDPWALRRIAATLKRAGVALL